MTLPIDLPPAGLLPGALKQAGLLQRLPLDLHRNLGIVAGIANFLSTSRKKKTKTSISKDKKQW